MTEWTHANNMYGGRVVPLPGKVRKNLLEVVPVEPYVRVHEVDRSLETGYREKKCSRQRGRGQQQERA